MESGDADRTRGALRSETASQRTTAGQVTESHPERARVARTKWHFGGHSRARQKGLVELPERPPFTYRGYGVRRAPRIVGSRRVLRALALIPAWVRLVTLAPAAATPVALVAVALSGLVRGRAGVLDSEHSHRRRARVAREPDAPWAWERVFDGGVVVASRAAALAGYAIPLAFAGATALLDGAEMLAGRRNVVFGATSLLGALYLAWGVQRAWFAGSTELRFRGPFVPAGGDVVFDFAVHADGPTIHALRCELVRMVQVPAASSLEAPVVACTHGGRFVPDPDVLPIGPGDQIELRFSLPPGASGNDLDGRPPVLWELVIDGETNSGRYEERFPVPIYDVPAGAPPARAGSA